MGKIKSETVLISKSQETIYSFLSNFNNFQHLMPPQVTDWKSTENNCSFTIQGMASLGMRIKERIPFSKIIIIPEGKVPFNFELHCLFAEKENNQTETQLIFDADMNPMLSMMATKPLTNFVNILVQQLKVIIER